MKAWFVVQGLPLIRHLQCLELRPLASVGILLCLEITYWTTLDDVGLTGCQQMPVASPLFAAVLARHVDVVAVELQKLSKPDQC